MLVDLGTPKKSKTKQTCFSLLKNMLINRDIFQYSDILPCAHACLVKTTSSKAFLCTNPGAGPGRAGAGEGAAWPGNFGKNIWKYEIDPLVIQHSYWKWPFIVDLPMKWWFSIAMLNYQRVNMNICCPCWWWGQLSNTDTPERCLVQVPSILCNVISIN